jgi:hypothetical protein
MRVIGCFMLSVLHYSPAVLAQNIYQAQVSHIAASSETELISAAFARTLVKVTGRYDSLENDAFHSQLPPLSELVLQQTQLDETHTLISFEPDKVNQLLRLAQMPVWPEPRPTTLFWLAQETPSGEKTLLSNQQDNALIAGLEEGAIERGVPMLFPLLDLDDLGKLSLTDVWGRFIAPVVAASERYQPSHIMLVKVSLKGDQSVLTWQLIDAKGIPLVHGEEVGLVEDSGVQVMNLLADYFVGQYGRVPAPRNDDFITVDIENVHGMAQVVAVKRLFQQQANVSQVTLKTVMPSAIQLQMQLQGTQDDLKQALARSAKLELLERNKPNVNATWRWQSDAAQ